MGAVDKHVHFSEAQLNKYRLDWCKKWLVRARDLDQFENAVQRESAESCGRSDKGQEDLAHQRDP